MGMDPVAYRIPDFQAAYVKIFHIYIYIYIYIYGGGKIKIYTTRLYISSMY